MVLSDTAAGSLVDVLGYHSFNDGGGGKFVLRSASDVPDYGTRFPSQKAGYLWERVMTSCPISVKWFGAIGDGISDDTAALTAASKFAKGGTLHIPKGTYLISKSIYVQGSWIGDGPNSTIFKLADIDFGAPAIIVTGIGYTAEASAFSIKENRETPLGNIIKSVLQQTNNQNLACPWGANVKGFGIQPRGGWYSRTKFTQNGMLVQQIAECNISDIRIAALNGFGLFEESTQDMMFSNIHIEFCGNSSKHLAAYVVDSLTEGAFNSASRVHHYYIFLQASIWRAMETGAVGSRGPGRGGSAQNSWQFIHAEHGDLPNEMVFGGLMDHYLYCSLGSNVIRIRAPRGIYDACDFTGCESLVLELPAKEVSRFNSLPNGVKTIMQSGVAEFNQSAMGEIYFLPVIKNTQLILGPNTSATIAAWKNEPTGTSKIVVNGGSLLVRSSEVKADLNIYLMQGRVDPSARAKNIHIKNSMPQVDEK